MTNLFVGYRFLKEVISLSKRASLFIITILLALQANAKEGFYSDPTRGTNVITQNWDSVFLVHTLFGNTRKTATAFLARVERRSGSSHLYFITVNHGLNDSCVEDAVCARASLMQDVDIYHRPKNEPGPKGLLFNQVHLVARSVQDDFGILRVDYDESVDLPKPLEFVETCKNTPGELAYTIGFPKTSLRAEPAGNRIPYRNLLIKRWSQGIFVKSVIANYGNDSVRLRPGFTIDTISGNSGGPILNYYGQVISFVQRSRVTEKNGYTYNGREKEPVDWHTLGAHCSVLARLGKIMQNDSRQL